MTQFNKLLENAAILEYLSEHKFEKATDVQAKSLPAILSGDSASILAQTGTGKTLAYCLPLVQKLKEEESAEGFEIKEGHPRAVILAPTRELATQVYGILKDISHHAKLRVRLLVGGDSGKKNKALAMSKIDILVAGPGRAFSALKRKEIVAKETRYLIFDEADQLLDMGFSKDIEGIYRYFEWDDTQVVLVSATMSDQFKEFSTKVFPKVEFKDVTLDGSHTVKQTIETFNISLDYTEKFNMTEMFIEKEAMGSGVIFLNQKGPAEELFKKLQTSKSVGKRKTYLLHGGMEVKERKISFDKFKATGGILICTDIAARGIDINTLNWVLNYDMPFEAVYYIHRSGRVGRNGRKGLVYNFVTYKDFDLVVKINEAIKNQSSIKLSPLSLNKPKVSKVAHKDAPTKKEANKKKREVVNRRKNTPRYKR